MIANRPALGVFPNRDWPSKLKNVLLNDKVKKYDYYHFFLLY